jgi:serine/threonine protein kinase
LLTEDSATVKIADFGVARFNDLETPITRVGTNIYSPPEHSPHHASAAIADETARLTPAADIYSLGKTVYSIITAESPRYFAGTAITELPLDERSRPWAVDLLKILERATQDDPSARYQTVDEFWTDFRSVARHVQPGAAPELQLSSDPRARVSRGYSPITPARPRFDTSRDLRIRFPAIMRERRDPEIEPVGSPDSAASSDPVTSNGGEVLSEPQRIPIMPQGNKTVRRRRPLRKLAAAMIVVASFASVLYLTHSYLNGSTMLSGLASSIRQPTATANTDIYLRPSPNTNNDPVGLVTKNSKVRIVNSQNNWYQVDVIEQGRARANQAAVSRGWLNGKYLDLD